MTDGPEPDLPFVTVIVPMLDEIGFIGPCVEGFLAQRYPADRLEILVIDGGSTDGSREVVTELGRIHPRVRLVDNPRRVAAAAANVGIAEAHGEILCFLSAHGVPDPDYVATSVRLLSEEPGAVGVGGRYLHVGTEPRSRAIGLAMASPFGMASPHRSSTERVEVDTISHPTFVRQALVDVGGYDETLLRNEDYELNYRLRANGGKLVFCPEISSVYRPRGSLGTLRRQFFDYGRWKATVIRRHPRATQPRHLVPPLAVLGGLTTPVLATSRTGRRVVLAGAVAYGGLLAVAGAREHPRREGASVSTLIAAFPVIHASWGLGVLVGLVRDAWASLAGRRERR
jgi:GT2 family glycosyltransferase